MFVGMYRFLNPFFEFQLADCYKKKTSKSPNQCQQVVSRCVVSNGPNLANIVLERPPEKITLDECAD